MPFASTESIWRVGERSIFATACYGCEYESDSCAIVSDGKGGLLGVLGTQVTTIETTSTTEVAKRSRTGLLRSTAHTPLNRTQQAVFATVVVTVQLWGTTATRGTKRRYSGTTGTTPKVVSIALSPSATVRTTDEVRFVVFTVLSCVAVATQGC